MYQTDSDYSFINHYYNSIDLDFKKNYNGNCQKI
jgi:hypothetical protein